MQVFIIGSPIQTAKALDKKRLNKQILECNQIIQAIAGNSTAWKNHPCVLQYRESLLWLRNYMKCLDCYQKGDMISAELFSSACDRIRPPFHIAEYFKQMKRRLYTKDPEFYGKWADLGKSEVNWYFVDGEWRYYIKGERVEVVQTEMSSGKYSLMATINRLSQAIVNGNYYLTPQEFQTIIDKFNYDREFIYRRLKRKLMRVLTPEGLPALEEDFIEKQCHLWVYNREI